MPFCSSYGYDYGNCSESEECDIDDEEEGCVTAKVRKADPNIIYFKFDKLSLVNEMFAGEPKRCKACTAVMSFLSQKNIEHIEDKLIWKCEFCETVNDMTGSIDDVAEIPKDDEVTFLIEAAKPLPKNSNEVKNVKENVDNSHMVFCIDVSGSMDTVIQTKKQENGENNGRRKSVTRLDGVKIACMETLSKLKDDEPEKQITLTTFSDKVKYYGDCSEIANNNPLIEIGKKDDLTNKEIIQTKAINENHNIKNISQTHPNIEQRIKNLNTEGSTALGPALLFSVSLASKKTGSSVILCTDGAANIGLGTLEYAKADEGEKFYDEVADFAKDKGVIVNVISMEGTDCKLAILGRVADKTNGSLSIVNPLNLSEEFKNILESRLVATNVEAKLIVNNKYIYIRDEELEAEEARAIENNDEKAREELDKRKKSTSVKDVGNANIDTEITFEYAIRKQKNDQERNEALKDMPFQLQITYKTPDGSKALRVVNEVQKFTRNREEAEKSIIAEDVLFTNKAHRIAEQVYKSNVVATKYRDKAYEKMMLRNNKKEDRYQKEQSNWVKRLRKRNFKVAKLSDQDAAYLSSNLKMSKKRQNKQKKDENEDEDDDQTTIAASKSNTTANNTVDDDEDPDSSSDSYQPSDNDSNDSLTSDSDSDSKRSYSSSTSSDDGKSSHSKSSNRSKGKNLNHKRRKTNNN